jgi:hypothetical protein
MIIVGLMVKIVITEEGRDILINENIFFNENQNIGNKAGSIICCIVILSQLRDNAPRYSF